MQTYREQEILYYSQVDLYSDNEINGEEIHDITHGAYYRRIYIVYVIRLAIV